jgi:RNA-directed DNA polymerase
LQEGQYETSVPTVADRIAQTVVCMVLEPEVEPVFHEDSYGYRPGRSAHDALAATRKRCWENNWVIDIDIRAFFDTIDHNLLMRAVERHTRLPWVLLYVRRWLAAPVQHADGTLRHRGRGSPQGGLCSAEHNEPYAQRWIMRSARRLPLVGAVAAVGRCA